MSKRKKGGRRCVAGDCMNSAHGSEYVMYSIANVKDENTKKKWLDFVVMSRKAGNFDPSKAKTVYICDGHFKENDFRQSQLMIWRSNLRSKAPELNPDAVPSVITARSPHFAKRAKDPLLLDLQQGQGQQSTHVDPISSITNAHDEPATKKRRRSRYVMQKVVNDIAQDYEEPVILHTEVDCQVVGCMENHAISIQTEEVSFQHQQTQADVTLAQPHKKRTRHKKQQFHYKGQSVGTQTEEPEVTCQCYCNKQRSVMKNQAVQCKPPTTAVDEEEDDYDTFEDAAEPADDPKDADWEPTGDISNEHDDADYDDEYINEEIPPHEDRKYIVFETKLMELFQCCPERYCGAPCRISRSTARCHGSMLVITQHCTLCDYVRRWTSQPMIGNIPGGNLILSAGILFGAACPTKVLRVLNHANIQGFTMNTFLNHQKYYLQPSVVTLWRNYQKTILDKLREIGEPLILGGDARCDSPGHCAKYGSYTFMDMTSGLVIDIQLVQSTEVKNSNAMELEGLRRGMAFLYSEGLTVGTLITDRHVQIPKFLRENYPDVIHKYDAWHITKSVKKQLTAVAKLTDCEDVSEWQKSVINHLYWSASSTPDGDGDLIAAKFLSVVNHIKNVHDGHSDHEEFSACVHGELPPREWLREDSRSYDKICEVVTKPYLIKCIKKISPMEQTSNVEAFHGVICMWAPKLTAYSYTGMKCRLFLACLHWNENGNRDQATTSEGELQYAVCSTRQSAGGFTVKKVLTACTYGYAGQLFQQTVKLGEDGDKRLRLTLPDLKGKETLASKYQQDRPSKADAVQAHLNRGRFNAITN